MSTATVEREEAGMAEVSEARFEEFAARVEEGLDRAHEKTDERFARAEEKADERFVRLAEQITHVDEKTEVQFEKLVEQVGHVASALGDLKDRQDRFENRIDGRLEGIETRIGRVDERISKVDERIDKLSVATFSGAIGLVGSVLAGFAAMIVLIATQL